MRGKIFNFQRYAVHDGPGIRSAVFLSGCPLRCLWCCNPESFLDNGSFNREVEVEEIMEWVLEDKCYFKNSGGGITLSGGEPLFNINFAEAILEGCKRENINTVIDTCGHVPWANFEVVSGLVDYYLYDIKHTDTAIHKSYTGADNLRIIDNLKKLSQEKKRIFLRVPLIPGYNTDEEAAKEIGRLAKEISALEVHLLPYHRLGEKKYSQLKTSYKLTGKKDLMSYSEGRTLVNNFSAIIRSYVKNVHIGG